MTHRKRAPRLSGGLLLSSFPVCENEGKRMASNPVKPKPECDFAQIALNRPRSVTTKILYVVMMAWGIIALTAMLVLASR